MANQAKKKFRFDISVWVGISAIIVLAIVSAIMTLTHFQRQREQAVALFIEKGATLMQTFEAGLRDRPDISEDNFPLRKLLMETAQQPDIDYMILADEKGMIIADSDPSMLGQQYGLDLDLKNITANREIHWRQVANPEGAGTFEVYRSFFPQVDIGTEERSAGVKPARQNNIYIIYVGFNMAKIEQASREDTRNTIITAVILLLIGSLAIISLVLVQAYRLARTSLSRMTVFSEALVKNMPIGLVALDENGNIATCNEKAGAILNIDCVETAGKQAQSALPVPLQKIFTELPEHSGLVEEDLQLISGQKESKILEIVAAGLTDGGISAGKIMLLRDVTALRQLENEVAKSRHLTSIASLAAGVAHEIRNPLSSIKGFAVYFKERFSGNAEEQKTADIMIQEVERLNRVISQLIEFARPLELKREKTYLPDLIQHTLSLIAAEAKKNNIVIINDIAFDLPFTEVDSDKVKQVLLNIFLNSLAAMKNGGNLAIKIVPENENIIVNISDTGTGIEKMDLPRIYDPYFTSKPAGTGLGLAVVQKIMEAHGGTINVESVIGRGTTVLLQFPLTSAQ
ncbi:MAG: ATP-binding protein [Smithellaceae bacterium]